MIRMLYMIYSERVFSLQHYKTYYNLVKVYLNSLTIFEGDCNFVLHKQCQSVFSESS